MLERGKQQGQGRVLVTEGGCFRGNRADFGHWWKCFDHEEESGGL